MNKIFLIYDTVDKIPVRDHLNFNDDLKFSNQL